MVVCWGNADCKECKNECKDWFANDPGMKSACLDTCKNNNWDSKDDFLNSVGQGSIQTGLINIENRELNFKGEEAKRVLGLVVQFSIVAVVIVLVGLILMKKLAS